METRATGAVTLPRPLRGSACGGRGPRCSRGAPRVTCGPGQVCGPPGLARGAARSGFPLTSATLRGEVAQGTGGRAPQEPDGVGGPRARSCVPGLAVQRTVTWDSACLPPNSQLRPRAQGGLQALRQAANRARGGIADRGMCSAPASLGAAGRCGTQSQALLPRLPRARTGGLPCADRCPKKSGPRDLPEVQRLRSPQNKRYLIYKNAIYT